MKKLVLISFIMISAGISAQKIAENNVDEFTKNSVIRTSWERLVYEMKGTMYFRVSKINNNVYFDIKLMNGSVFSVDKGPKVMFKLSNDSIYTLNNLEYTITSKGGGAIGFNGSGAQGLYLSCVSLDDVKLNTLINEKITKIRVYINDGYVEYEIKPKYADTVANAINLVSN